MTPDEATARALAHRVCALIPEWRESQLTGFEYLVDGYSNANYRFMHDGLPYVVRIPSYTQPFVDRALESRVLRDLPEGLPPAVCAYDTSDGAMVTRWVEGNLMAEERALPAAQLARQLLEFHERLPDFTRNYDPLALVRTYLEGIETPQWIVDLASRPWRPVGARPCHNDLNPWNIIVGDEQTWTVLDWEFAAMNDPLFDMVSLVLGSGLDEDYAQACAAAYIGASPQAARLSDCIEAFWLREYGWAVAQLQRGNQREEIVERADLAYSALCQRVT
ncbi:MAG: choline/ethanolamine kinase family protein [Pseudomonadales bacterium]|jgi:thiamine kinase-like enzyme|nr:choline/ethanolamine kinase family protein [Pseudomonadales bacterium]MDP6826257.1 choline/ethanolamine kinase family protein [Pseudomonadales bacterium]